MNKTGKNIEALTKQVSALEDQLKSEQGEACNLRQGAGIKYSGGKFSNILFSGKCSKIQRKLRIS